MPYCIWHMIYDVWQPAIKRASQPASQPIGQPSSQPASQPASKPEPNKPIEPKPYVSKPTGKKNKENHSLNTMPAAGPAP